MTKNRSMRIAILVLALALLTSCFVGSTFAKYASQATGSASATVANWAFTVNETDITETGAVNFNLFTTAATDTKTDATETDVVAGKIAPGTKGSFTFDLANASDVTVDYAIVLTADLQGMPIVFKATGMDDYGTIADVNAKLAGTLGFVGNTTDAETEATVTVEWMWAFGESVDDNAHENKVLTVNATYTATQVD